LSISLHLKYGRYDFMYCAYSNVANNIHFRLRACKAAATVVISGSAVEHGLCFQLESGGVACSFWLHVN